MHQKSNVTPFNDGYMLLHCGCSMLSMPTQRHMQNRRILSESYKDASLVRQLTSSALSILSGRHPSSAPEPSCRTAPLDEDPTLRPTMDCNGIYIFCIEISSSEWQNFPPVLWMDSECCPKLHSSTATFKCGCHATSLEHILNICIVYQMLGIAFILPSYA